MSKPKYKVGQVVFLNEFNILANKVKIMAVVPPKRWQKYHYIVQEGGGEYYPVYSEDDLVEIQAL